MTMVLEPDCDVILRAFFKDVDERNWDAMMDYVHDDVTYDRPGYLPLRGRAAFLDFYKHRRIIAQGEHKLMEVIVTQDRVACQGTFRGISRAGVSLSADFADFYQFRGDKILMRRTFFYAPLV